MTIVPTHTVTADSYPQKSLFKPIRINGVVTGISNRRINGVLAPPEAVDPLPSNAPVSLLAKFVQANKEIASYKYAYLSIKQRRSFTYDLDRDGKPITIDGHSLSIAAVTAAARFNAQIELTDSPITKHNVKKSRAAIDNKIASGTSVYGVSTGFGGSGKQIKKLLL
jgi:phenylalanine ammonia-lyase